LSVILAIDTSSRTLGLGLHSGDQVLAESLWQGNRHHTVELGPQIALLLRRSNCSLDDLRAIAVALGPGSYTGLRIGMALAKGLAVSRGLDLVGVSTFEVLAQAQSARNEPMYCVIEAGRKKIAGLWYKWGRRGWKSQGEAEVTTWQAVLESITENSYIVGELEPEAREHFKTSDKVILAPPSHCVRRPSVLAEIAQERLRSGKLPDSERLAPIYLNTP
jgi:tRNA threonylcarbamoyladenosine biosynthesis protein TsaB